MAWTKKRIPVQIQNLYSKFRKGDYSFICLNTSQFLGVLNDNVYKLLMIFLLISTLGTQESSAILAAAGALYVTPFLLFSAAAGVLADRFSKEKLIKILKAVEIFLMLLAILAFYTESLWGCYSVLFLLATHSAIFGPSKYGIIPEIVEKQDMLKANNHLIAFTYLAMIIGTFLASFLTELTSSSYVICVFFCLLFSLFGFLASFGIQKTQAQKSTKKITPFFLGEIYKTIQECRKTPLLAPSLFGSAYFLFIGAFTQLNIIAFAIESLRLSEYAGGYLFLLTALGIAGGSIFSNKILKKRLNLNTSCLAGFAMGLILLFFWVFSSYLAPTATLLVLLGVFGGVFVVPFDTFIQGNSPLGKRGQTIGAANFLGFFGVLVASFCLYFFGHVMGLSAAAGFFYMGILTLLSSSFLSLRLLEVFLPFFAKAFCSKKTLRCIDPLKLLESSSIFLLDTFSFPLLWTASSHAPQCQILLLQSQKTFPLKLLSLSPNIHFLPEETPLETVLSKAKSLVREDCNILVFLSSPLKESSSKRSLFAFSFKEEPVCHLRLSQNQALPSVFVEKADI